MGNEDCQWTGKHGGNADPGGAVGQAARITLGQAITRSMLKRGASLNAPAGG
ncbi:hypothetical protein [Vibrio penaeicida]|uniref:hypothetical protein n=1 Tax=Vibrio penaeicida TaxID=104609 RepID=UPI001CC7D1FC|nr:hypothetical protein [Vibrio penaeicida]